MPIEFAVFGICTPFDVLHYRAKSCKWVFPESIFSFKHRVILHPLALDQPGVVLEVSCWHDVHDLTVIGGHLEEWQD